MHSGVCRRLSSSVTLHGGPAVGFTLAGQAMTSCRLKSNYSSTVTLHGGPVVIRPVRATPCYTRNTAMPVYNGIFDAGKPHTSVESVLSAQKPATELISHLYNAMSLQQLQPTLDFSIHARLLSSIVSTPFVMLHFVVSSLLAAFFGLLLSVIGKRDSNRADWTICNSALILWSLLNI